VLDGEGRGGVSVGLVLTGDDEIQDMNSRWRGQDRPTDVLAFPGDPDPLDPHLGDVVLSMDRAREQAPRFSATLEEEVVRLVVHGLLHLLGYDHHTPADGRRMKARERAYLAGFPRGSILLRAAR
jgi:probable rRNA maturation factor